MPFAAALLLSSISFFSSSLIFRLCSSSSSLLSRCRSSMVNFTRSWRRRSSWQKHHSIETSNVPRSKQKQPSPYLHQHMTKKHTLYFCLSPFLYLLSQPPLLFQFFLLSPLFPPLLHPTSHLPLLFLGPKTEEITSVTLRWSNLLYNCGKNSSNWTAWKIADIGASLLQVGLVLGSLVLCFRFLLTLSPILMLLRLPGFPALDSLLGREVKHLLETLADIVLITATSMSWILRVSFGPADRSAPDASPHVARSPPVF